MDWKMHIYFHQSVKTTNPKFPLQLHILSSEFSDDMPAKFMTNEFKDIGPVEPAEQLNRLKIYEKLLALQGKIKSTSRKSENNLIITDYKMSLEGNKDADVRFFFLDKSFFVLEVQQYKDKYNPDLVHTFFDSFHYIGQLPQEKNTIVKSTSHVSDKQIQFSAKSLETADKNNSTVQNEIGKSFLNKTDVPGKDYQEAMTWFLKSAEQGNIRAMNNIGLMYENGLGVTKDTNIAIQWYEKAAEQDLDIAQMNLSSLYLSINSVETNLKAEKWLLRAAKNGNSQADYTLGQLYEGGFAGIASDYKKANFWYGKAFQNIKSNKKNNLK